MANPSVRAAKKRQTRKSPSRPRPASRARVNRPPRPGQKCAECGQGKLDYDGLLQLSCPVCESVASCGGFT